MTTQLSVQDSQIAAKWDSFLHDYCREQITEAIFNYPEKRSLIVSFNDIQLRDPDLANRLLQNPSHCLRIGSQILHQVDSPVDPTPRLNLRISGLPNSQVLQPRQLGVEHLGRLVAVRGIVKKATDPLSQLLEAVFDCNTCGNRLHAIQETEYLSEPVICDSCEKPGPWTLKVEESRFIDSQLITIEDDHSDLTGQPERIPVILQGELIRSLNAGEETTIVGIPTTQNRRLHNKASSSFHRVLEAVYVEPRREAIGRIELTSQDVKDCLAFASSDTYRRLRESFAPTIYGMEPVKDAMLLSLFGGVRKSHADGTNSRGDISILLIGEPGVAKSQLLKYLTTLSPKSGLISGKGATVAGVIGAATKDEATGGWTIEAGAIALADEGIFCVDEIGQCNKDVQSALHQAMEQQEVSISKAGAQATLRTRCPVIAAGNPPTGLFDTHTDLAEQTGLSPSLISRFDLMFLLKNYPNKEKDLALFNHIAEKHYGNVGEPKLAPSFIRKYVTHAKTIKPTIGKEAREVAWKYYSSLRHGENNKGVTIRQAEALFRMGEAAARMRLSNQVSVEDMERVIAIHKDFLGMVAVDLKTGSIDLGSFEVGKSYSQQERVNITKSVIKRLVTESEGRGYAQEDAVIAECVKAGLTEDEAQRALDDMRKRSETYAKGGGGTVAFL